MDPSPAAAARSGTADLLAPPTQHRSYAAPENLRSGLTKAGACPAPSTPRYDGQQADVWSCGVVLFVMMYGYPPWDMARESSYDFRMYKVGA